jgi:hypothetical protein
LTWNLIFHARMKHREVDYHVVKEGVTQKLLEVQPISTKDQVADVFTKPLKMRLLEHFKGNLNKADSHDSREVLE